MDDVLPTITLILTLPQWEKVGRQHFSYFAIQLLPIINSSLHVAVGIVVEKENIVKFKNIHVLVVI